MLITVASAGGCSSDTSPAKTGDGGSTGGKTSTGGSISGNGGGNTAGAGGMGFGGGGPATTCTTAFGTTCDGAEDCPTGQRCCAKFQTGYVQAGCFDSCAALQGDAAAGGVMMGGITFWAELCHAGDTCENSATTCGTSRYLPSSLARCLPASVAGMAMSGTPDGGLGHAKNAVNCGNAVCGAAEQCCVRQPLEPYCAPKTATCECNVPDAGKPTKDAGTGGAAPKSDAATKD